MSRRQFIWNPKWQLAGAAVLAVVACMAAMEWWWPLFASTIAVLAIAAYAVWVEPGRFRLDRRAIVVESLARELNGFRVAHIGAISLGTSRSQEGLERALAGCAEADVDLIICSGALLSDGAQLERLITAFAGLETRHGVYVHHHHAPSGSRLEAALLSLGITVVSQAGHNLGTAPLTISACQDGSVQLGIHGAEDAWPLLSLVAMPAEMSASFPGLGRLYLPKYEPPTPLEDYAPGLATGWGRLNMPPGMTIITLRSPRVRRARYGTVAWRHIVSRLMR